MDLERVKAWNAIHRIQVVFPSWWAPNASVGLDAWTLRRANTVASCRREVGARLQSGSARIQETETIQGNFHQLQRWIEDLGSKKDIESTS